MNDTWILLRFALFFLFVALLLGAASAYVHRSASKAFALGPRPRLALALLLALGLLLMFASRFFRRVFPSLSSSLSDGALSPIAVASSTLVVAVIISALLLALADLLHTLASLPARFRRARPLSSTAPRSSPVPAASAAPAPPVTRRTFLTQATTGSALLIGSSSSLYGSLVGRHDYQLVEVAVPIPGLSRRLDGYTLVQLSDIHFGLFVGEPELEAALDRVRRARPDRVVLTGDLVDHDPRYAEMLGRFIRRLGEVARDGVTVIPGNHDYYAGIAEVLGAASGAGATVLRNGGQVVGGATEGFALLGLDDIWGARLAGEPAPDLDRVLAAVPADLPRILLWHNPSHFADAAGKVALQLSGHTHGGQVNLGVRPADLLLPHPWIAGSYELKGTRLYVNRGFGTAGPPTRIGAPPEVTKIVLSSA